jgi:hypothetical protein
MKDTKTVAATTAINRKICRLISGSPIRVVFGVAGKNSN